MSGHDQALWRQYAQTYAMLYGILPVQRALQDVVRAAGITSSSNVLDVGCGTGFLMQVLTQFFGVRPQITGLDQTAAMLEVARAVPYAGSFQPILADLNRPHTEWNLGGQTYDRLVANNSLYAVDSPVSVLRELLSVAAKTARLVVSTPRPDASIQAVVNEHLRMFAAAGGSKDAEARRVAEVFAGIRGINEQILASNTFHFPDSGELEDWFVQAGWRITSVRTTYAGQNWLVVAIRG